MRALKFSANAALDDGSAEAPTEIPAWAMALQVVISVLFFIFMYKLVPLYLTESLRTMCRP